MKWVKKGLIYRPQGEASWKQHTALTPTPLLINENVIRIYAGFRDADGVSRIGYVDVSKSNPLHIIKVSEQPVLDVGRKGHFDDNGVILGDLVRDGDLIRLYYVGFQKVEKVKFLAFSGLAISSDNGETFERFSEAPILDRSDEGLFIRAIHSVLQENGVWKFWYSTGSQWQCINDIPYPCYEIRYCESSDGVTFPKESTICIKPEGDEYRIGRPRVYRLADKYQMFYTKGNLKQEYLPGYAESEDGILWNRMDNQVGLSVSPSGWDSQTLCYPALLHAEQSTYLFYNGNNMGRDGFGYATLESL